MRGVQGGDFAVLGDDGAEGGATGQNDVLQTEVLDEPVARFLVGGSGKLEHVAHEQ